MPKFYGYSRVSTLDQADSGLGLEAHRAAIRREYEARWKHQGYEWVPTHEDPAVSAGKPLTSRPAGHALTTDVEAGDVVCFAKLDRGFRDARDALNTVGAWRDRGIRTVFLDLNIDTGTEMGWAMIGIGAIFAELERSRGRTRTREAMAALKARGVKLGPPRYGLCKRGDKGKRRFVVVPYEYHIGQKIVAWRQAGWDWASIAEHLNAHGTPRRSNKSLPKHFARKWDVWCSRRVYEGTLLIDLMIHRGEVEPPKPLPASGPAIPTEGTA